MKFPRGADSPRSPKFLIGVLIVFGFAIAADLATGRWSWGLFAWGALTGPVYVLWSRFQTIAITRRLYPPSAEREAAIDNFRRQSWKKCGWVYAYSVASGVAIGALAARWGAYLDIILTAAVVVTLLLPLLQLGAAPRGVLESADQDSGHLGL